MDFKLLLLLLGTSTFALVLKGTEDNHSWIQCWDDWTQAYENNKMCSMEIAVSKSECTIDVMTYGGSIYEMKKMVQKNAQDDLNDELSVKLQSYNNRVNSMKGNNYLIQCDSSFCTQNSTIVEWIFMHRGLKEYTFKSRECYLAALESLEKAVNEKAFILAARTESPTTPKSGWVFN